MPTPTFPHRRADEFEELLWQITGELAMTPASASLANAPFLDVEPDPEEKAEVEVSTRTADVAPELPARRAPIAANWIAGLAAAALLTLGGFGVGQLTEGPAVVTALELHDQGEHSGVLAVAHGPSTQIPDAPETASAVPASKAPAATVEEAKPEPKPTKRRVKRKAKPKPKAPSVAFEDL